MEEIKTPPTLRRVHTNHVTVSDTMTIMYRKKLVPSADLVADLSDEVSNWNGTVVWVQHHVIPICC